MAGQTEWYFPDGDLPDPVAGDRFTAHESLMILNPNTQVAHIELTLYWTDRPPTSGISFEVDGERVRCVRLDHPNDIGGVAIPYRTQYAMRLSSDVGVFIQYGRLDTAQPNFALVGLMGAQGGP